MVGEGKGGGAVSAWDGGRVCVDKSRPGSDKESDDIKSSTGTKPCSVITESRVCCESGSTAYNMQHAYHC